MPAAHAALDILGVLRSPTPVLALIGTTAARGRAAATVASIAAMAICWCAAPRSAAGDRLTDVFRNELAPLELGPLADVLADTVASTYPVASASSSVTYAYNPRLEAFERQTRVLGPIVGERAETIGEMQINVGVSYSYVDLESINGTDLSDLQNQPVVDGRVVNRRINGTVVLADGRQTNFLPAMVDADLDVDAHIVSPFLTYGITPGWDFNLTIPIVTSSLRAYVRDQIPDPRLPQFALPPGSPFAETRVQSFSESATGIGDVLFRTKYVLLSDGPVDLAATLGLSFPTGDDRNLHGSGSMRVQPALVASRVYFDRVQPLLNAGFDVNAENAERSVFRWAAGATAQAWGPLTAAVVFLGRHDLDEQTDTIDTPFFFQIERNDIFDVALGLRCLFADTGVISVNALLPLNDEGLRAEVVPTLEIQYAF